MEKLRKMSFRSSDLQVREIQSGNEQPKRLRLEGYFVRFNELTELCEGVYEYVSPTAFDKYGMANIKALFNHESGKPLAATNNNTLEIRKDEQGVFCALDLPDTGYARDAQALVKDGYITGCSFGFIEHRSNVDEVNGNLIFCIEEAELIEVSVCTFPQYENTSVKVQE